MLAITRMRLAAAVVLAALLTLGAAPAAEGQSQFPLKDGDTWVMIGDSITAQHLHTNYFEAFCFARFPRWTIHFRNSGVGGDTIPRALARFDRDAAVWKPTIISVELGMNDSGGGPGSTPVYIKGMITLADRIRAIQARPVFLSASPVNDGTTMAKPAGRNVTLDQYATALGELATREKVPFADQFHALVDLWGRNEMAHAAAEVLKLSARADVPRADLLKTWSDEWNKSGLPRQGISLMGDAVHPGPPGQLTMCVALLRGLHAPALVSKATIDASGKISQTTQCKITDVKAENGGVSFTRLDESLPMPIPDDARPALTLMPAIAELSQWMLTVPGLKAGEYDLSLDGTSMGRFSSVILAKGCNLGTLEKGSVADQGREVLKLVAAKEGLVGQFRGKSAAVAAAPTEQGKAELEAMNQQVLDADAKIRAAAQPKPHRFTITPVK